MTPKEKAKYIKNKLTINFDENNVLSIYYKQFALLLVDEIIKEMSDYYCTETLDKVNYWIEVKKELEK